MKDLCYTYLETERTIGIIHRNETGYYKTDLAECNKIKSAEEGKAFVRELNENLGVSIAEQKAMEFGSMFGWNVPAADPDNWSEDGHLIKEKLTV